MVMADDSVIADMFAGDSEMAVRMRSFDWSATPMGPPETWPPSARLMVRFLLPNRFPLLLFWGPDHIQFYNDACRPALGAKHPRCLGHRANKCFPEIWSVVGPLIEKAFQGGPAAWVGDLVLEVDRNGRLEEMHAEIAYSPVPDEATPSHVGGVLGIVHDITQEVVNERRMRLLRELGGRTLAEDGTPEAACASAARILARYTVDVPFALLYLTDSSGAKARLTGASGVDPGQPISPLEVDLGGSPPDGPSWPMSEVFRGNTIQIVERLGFRFGDVPPGPWSCAPDTAIIAPLRSNAPHPAGGVLVAGTSARLPLDPEYLGFFELLATQIANGIENARAYSQEKQRADGLAELDQAKTRFFSNVSHEFRAPLTLMLGPVADLLEKPDMAVADRVQILEMIYRSGLRLQKMVDSMLDFSRAEAGRASATFQPTDLSKFTTELASIFHSAAERAGLTLTVDAHPLQAHHNIHREMWEKVLNNLLSNPLKNTLEGGITVRVRDGGDVAVVEVVDTGIGISPEQLPLIFDRFHRVPNARSRTREGTGIGLALVRELVQLLGAEIDVMSSEGKGTTFAVAVPYGVQHLPSDGVEQAGRELASGLDPTRPGAASYVQEVIGWMPPSSVPGDGGNGRTVAIDDPSPGELVPAANAPRILVADDNADMREYVARLLRERDWAVEVVGDGRAALAAIRARPPDLVLSDVTMPGLDGFALLKAMRGDPATAAVPVILLSSRVGETARIAGAEAGADDYLIKPFGTHELLARVGAQLSRSRERSGALVAAQAVARAKSDVLAVMSHELRTPLNSISGYAEIMEQGIHGPVTAQQRIDLARIQQSQLHL